MSAIEDGAMQDKAGAQIDDLVKQPVEWARKFADRELPWSVAEIATRVRMMMRNDLDHEAVCTVARNCIALQALAIEAKSAELTRLREQYEAKDAEIARLKEHVREISRECNIEMLRAIDLAAENERLRKALVLYRDAVRIDALMEGPRFLGANSSALRRAWEYDREALADLAQSFKFEIGQPVRKVSGYAFDGVVRMRGLLAQGERYVVESEASPGLLHIFSDAQLEARVAPAQPQQISDEVDNAR